MDNQETTQQAIKTKFCKHCGAKIPEDAVICTVCGRQVEELKVAHSAENPSIVINNSSSSNNVNTNVNANTNVNTSRTSAEAQKVPKNKWISFLLCLFFGYFGAHKFYEGKMGMGILYIFTCGLFAIGWFVDIIVLLCKPNPYYV